MPDGADDIARDALDMIELYGDAAAQIARLRAEIAEENIRNQCLAQTWHDIADVIEGLWSKP